METYNVSFEGFEPSCGWAMYRYVESEFLPYLRAEVERWRVRRDEMLREQAALKSFMVDIEAMSKSRNSLVCKLNAKIPGGEKTLDEVMPIGVKEAEVEAPVAWSVLSSWLDAAKMPIEQIEFFYKHASKRVDAWLDLFGDAYESTVFDVRFWERTLELQHAHWVFEKASAKYKTKICREIVKALGEYVIDCQEQLGRYTKEEQKQTDLYKDIEWLYDEALKDLAYYRQIKLDIAEIGVQDAIKLSTRKVTPPTVKAPDFLPSQEYDAPPLV